MTHSRSVHAGCALGVLILFASLRASADERHLFSHYQRVQYQTKQGLAQDEVQGIAQTPDGFLWFGTRDGLARFDGIRFTIFRSEDNPGLAHNVIGSLLVDHRGRLWIATADGLSCYENNKFKSYGRADGLPHQSVHVMLEDHAGKLWFGTWAGLAFFDGVRFHTITMKDGLQQGVVLALAEDHEGGIWIGTQTGLVLLKNGAFRIYTSRNGLPSDEIDNLLVDHLGRLWAATERGFARLVSPDRFEKIREVHGSSWWLMEDDNGNVWASSTVSLARLGPGEVRFREESVAPGESAITMYQDKNGSIWLATAHAGLISYRWQPFVTYTTQDGLPDNRALNLYEDSRGSLWIGTSGGLSQRSHGAIHTLRASNLLRAAEVQAVAEDHEHRMWVGTSNGLIRFDGKKWKRISTHPILLPLDIRSLCIDRGNRVWIGSSEGLFIWDRGTVSRLTARDGLPGVHIAAIAEDSAGTILVATEGGLAVIASGHIEAYTKEKGLLSNFVPRLYKASDGSLWICTFGGLNRWKNGRLEQFTMPQGLSPEVLDVMEDDDGYFWIATYQGVFRIKSDDLEKLSDPGGNSLGPRYEYWGPQDGFQINFSNPPNQSVMWKGRDGTLWFATNNGIMAARPSDLTTTFSTPWPLVECMIADGEKTTVRTIDPGVRRLEFAFTAPSSHAPEQLEFRYRLDGFDHDWHDSRGQRFASFTNLPKGAYRFRVSVRRSGGLWSANEAMVAFQILPYWYEKNTFRILCGVALALVLWFVHVFRLRQANYRLSLVLTERSRVANELHDTLLQSLSGAAMQVRAALSHLKQGTIDAAGERLAAALDQMGRSQVEARQAIWELSSTQFNGNRLAEGLEEQARQLCGSGTALEYNISGSVRAIDSRMEEQIYRIALEAVTNAARHSEASRIAVDLNFTSNSLALSIRDNGCGFVQDGRSSPNGTHFGLKSMQERAQRCGGDLRIVTQPGHGTTVCLEVPIARTNSRHFNL